MTFLGTAPTTEHYKLGDWSTSLPVWRPGDCIDQFEHYKLGDWSTSLPVWRSGDCTDQSEHYKLGDWSTSLPVWRPGDCTDQSEHYMLGDYIGKFHFSDLATRLILRLPASSGTTSV